MEKKSQVKAYYRKGRLVKTHNRKNNRTKKILTGAALAGLVGGGLLLGRNKFKNLNNLAKHNKKGTLVKYDSNVGKAGKQKTKSNLIADKYDINSIYGLDYAMKEKYGLRYNSVNEYNKFGKTYNQLYDKTRSSAQAALDYYNQANNMEREYIMNLSRIGTLDNSYGVSQNPIIDNFNEKLFDGILLANKNKKDGIDLNVIEKVKAIQKAVRDPNISKGEKDAYLEGFKKLQKKHNLGDINDLNFEEDVNKIFKKYGFTDEEIKRYSRSSYKKYLSDLIKFNRPKGAKDKKKRKRRKVIDVVKSNAIRGALVGGSLGVVRGLNEDMMLKGDMDNNRYKNYVKGQLKFVKANKNKLPIFERIKGLSYKLKGENIKTNKLAYGLRGALANALLYGAIGGGLAMVNRKKDNK